MRLFRQSVIAATAFGVAAMTLAAAPTASAHELRSDGLISAELHVEPDDHPISGERTTFHLEFDNEPSGFSLSRYATTFTILLHGKALGSRPIAPPADDTSTNIFTFPRAATYTLRLNGTPKQGATTPAFSMSYPVDVYVPKSASAKINPWLWGSGGVAILAIIAAAIVMERKKADTPA